MVMAVRVFGILIAVFGVFYILNPNIIKPYMAFWKTGKRLYIGGLLSLLIGTFLLLAASQCRVSWFVALFGILGLVKGIVLSLVGQEKAVSMLDWWGERPVTFLRVHALFAIAIGALLIYCA